MKDFNTLAEDAVKTANSFHLQGPEPATIVIMLATDAFIIRGTLPWRDLGIEKTVDYTSLAKSHFNLLKMQVERLAAEMVEVASDGLYSNSIPGTIHRLTAPYSPGPRQTVAERP